MLSSMEKAAITFGEEVRRYRVRAGLSQETLAERLGISRVAVSQIERGETKRPSDDILEGLEQILGLSRVRSYELIGSLVLNGENDPAVILQQIAALPDHEARLEGWYQLPLALRKAITLLMQDVVQEAAMRYQEARTSTRSD